MDSPKLTKKKDKMSKMDVVDEKIEVEGESFINNLNDDCLILIFEYLHIHERIRLERVCKRWHYLSFYGWHNYKTLALSSIPVKTARDLESQAIESNSSRTYSNKIHPRVLQKVLLRCGFFLTEIIIDMAETKELYSIIIKYCPKITKLTITNSVFNSEIEEMLAEAFQDLVEFNFKEMFTLEEIENTKLQTIFKKNSKLKTVNITDYNFKGPCLRYLPESLESLAIVNCQKMNLLYESIPKLTNLNYLEICTVPEDETFYRNEFLEIIANCTKLKSLYLNSIDEKINIDGGFMITRLPNLTKLSVWYCSGFVTSNFISRMIQYCPNIVLLDISGCSKITSRDLSSIFSMSNLYVLNICMLKIEYFFIDENYVPLKLKKVCALGSDFNDESICSLLRSSPYLDKLSLVLCKSLTKRVVEVAEECTNSRTNNIPLVIHACGTVFGERTVKISPMLQIERNFISQP